MGELLIRLIERYNISASAIELYDGSIAVARNRAQGRIPADSITFINQDAREVFGTSLEQVYELGICVGSTHALGGYQQTLEALTQCVKPGGYLLLGDGYWKQPPSKEYLQALGAVESDLTTHYANVKIGEELGLTPLWSTVASEDDWDEYEWLYSMSIENYCCQNPDDPDHGAMLQRIRSWRQTYLNWGRDTLGFGLYLFRI
jgi:hypothetical protein